MPDLSHSQNTKNLSLKRQTGSLWCIDGNEYTTASPEAVIAALPNFVVLRSAKRALADRFQSLVLGIRDELDLGRAGCAIIAADLASALFIMMLREHLEDAPPATGLFALLKPRPSAPAVVAMLREPSRDWTLDMLAEASASSRSTLVRAFRKVAGMAPLAAHTSRPPRDTPPDRADGRAGAPRDHDLR